MKVSVFVYTYNSMYDGDEDIHSKVYGTIEEARKELAEAKEDLLNTEDTDNFVFEESTEDYFCGYLDGAYSENHLVLTVEEQIIDLPFEITENIYRTVDREYHKNDVKGEYENIYGKECLYDDEALEHIADRAENIISKCDSYWDCYWGCFDSAVKEFEGENE